MAAGDALKGEGGAEGTRRPGWRPIVERVVFFVFLGFLVLVFAGIQFVQQLGRDRTLAAAVTAEGPTLLEGRQFAPGFAPVDEDGRPLAPGHWRVTRGSDVVTGGGVAREIAADGDGFALLLDDRLRRARDDESEELASVASRALSFAPWGADFAVLARDDDNRRLILLEPGPVGRLRRDLVRLGEGQRLISAALSVAGDRLHAAWILETEGLGLTMRDVTPGRPEVELGSWKLEGPVVGPWAFGRDGEHGFLVGRRGADLELAWYRPGAEAPFATRSIDPDLPFTAGAFRGSDVEGAVFGMNRALVTVLPEGDEIALAREEGRLPSPWWGLLILVLLFAPVFVALGGGVIRAIVRTEPLVVVGARPAPLLRRLGALLVDLAIAEACGVVVAALAGRGIDWTAGLGEWFQVSGAEGTAEAVSFEPDLATTLRLLASLGVLVAVLAISERLTGRTPGKWMLGLAVRSRTGNPTWLQALQRRALLVVDLFFFAGICIFLNRARQRVGDLAADTVVVVPEGKRVPFAMPAPPSHD